MVIYMTNIHPIALDSLAVLLIAPLSESLSIDEQAIVGAFLNILGDLLAFNSAYLSNIQNSNSDNDKPQDNDDSNHYEAIQKSISQMKSELEKIKNSDH